MTLKNTFLRILASALSLLTAIGFGVEASAQMKSRDVAQITRMSPRQRAEARKKFMEDYPLLASVKSRMDEPLTFDRLKTSWQSPIRVQANALSTKRVPHIWASRIYKRGWSSSENDYSYDAFRPTLPFSFERLGEMPEAMSTGGAGIVGDKLYSVYFDTSGAQLGYYLAILYCFDINTWEQCGEAKRLDDMSLMATETAQAPDGSVYGQFYSADYSLLQLGKADYPNMSRSNIAPLPYPYVALGITSDYRMFGVRSNGNLYEISLTDGKERLVGSTGVAISDGTGTRYYQTGEIDQADDTFYWASYDANGNSVLYTVDLATGAATAIGSFPDNDEFTGMIIPQTGIAADAPYKATHLIPEFQNGNTSGILNFKAPAETYAGDALTGALTYSILLDDDTENEICSGTTQPGADARAEISNLPEGMIRLSVVLKNDAGKSPVAFTDFYVGLDTPEAPKDVKLSISDDAKVNLSWVKPGKGIHNGYVGDVTYDVVRIVNGDSTVVAKNLSATAFSEKVELGKLSNYNYAVCAHHGTHTGAFASSNKNVAGRGLELPYRQTFDDPSSLDLFTIVDSNNDNISWQWTNEDGGLANCWINYNLDSDDWLITPSFHFEANRKYTVSIHIGSGFSAFTEVFEAKWGKGNKIEDLNNDFIETTEVKWGSVQDFTREITVSEEGDYCIGIHALSPKGQQELVVDNIIVEAEMPQTAPAAVTDFTAKGDEKGGMKATISFRSPMKDLKGDAIGSLSKIVVLRNNRIVKVFENPAVGGTFSFIEDGLTRGYVSYDAICYMGSNYGPTATTETEFIGVDEPAFVTENKAEDLHDEVRLTWNEVTTGMNGLRIVPEDITYSVIEVDSLGFFFTDTIASGLSDNTITFNYNTDKGFQHIQYWSVLAENSAGSTFNAVAASLPVGKHSTVPFIETFAGGEFVNRWWTEVIPNSYTYWNPSTNVSSDGDGGSAVFMPFEGGQGGTLNTFKFSLSGTNNPYLIYKRLATPGKDVRIFVDIVKKNGEKTTIEEVDYLGLSGDARWELSKVDLSDFIGEDYVFIKLGATAGEYDVIAVDNIYILDLVPVDLEATVTASDLITKGNNINVSVKVCNIGNLDAAQYHVKIFADDKLIEDKLVSDPLPSFESRTFTFTVPTNTVEYAGKDNVTIKCEVEVADDADTANNSGSVKTSLADCDLPPVGGATLSEGEGSSIIVSWIAPTVTEKLVTEDFESYDNWKFDNIGDWTLVSNDFPDSACGFSPNWRFPLAYQSLAFAVMDFNQIESDLTLATPGLSPHGGNQFLGSPYASNSAGDYIDSDNWLISPRLSGKAQTITFWAKNFSDIGYLYPETFRILTSTESTDIATFKALGNNIRIVDGEWKQYEFSLPEGTLYFAIHQISKAADDLGNMLFSIDDVRFRIGLPKPVGYNLYKDGTLIANFGAGDELRYSEANDGKKHRYSLTAVYDGGVESLPVDAESEADISTIVGEDLYFDIYDLNGRLVRSHSADFRNLPSGIYVIKGKKIFVR